MNILEASDRLKEAMRRQIQEYRTLEPLILQGDLYRLLNPFVDGGRYAYYFVNEDNSQILLNYLQNNGDVKKKTVKLKISRADKAAVYEDRFTGNCYTGEELRQGLSLESANTDCFAVSFHFCKK